MKGCNGVAQNDVATSLFSFLFVIEHMMPLCMVISWVYSVAMMIQHIVAEKEQRLKEVRAHCCRVVASLPTPKKRQGSAQGEDS